VMRIELQKIEPIPLGVYGPSRDQFAERLAYLHPEAAELLSLLERETGGLVYSDMYRDAGGSLEAHRAKSGVQPPGYSAHNYGLAFDLAIDDTLRRLGCSYHELLDRLAAHGWYCYRRDRERGREDWHFNYLGPRPIFLGAATSVPSTWSHVAEANIISRYPELARRMEPNEIQEALAVLFYYPGIIDGELGPVTTDAAHRFAHAWDTDPHGTRFERTLRFVAAEVSVNQNGSAGRE